MVVSQQTSMTPARLEERIGFLIGYLERAVECGENTTYRTIAQAIAEIQGEEYAWRIQELRSAAENYCYRGDAVKLLQELGYKTTAKSQETQRYIPRRTQDHEIVGSTLSERERRRNEVFALRNSLR